MKNESDFERGRPELQFSIRKQKAILERDLIRIQSQNQAYLFNAKTLILALLLFSLIATAAALAAVRFDFLLKPLPNCRSSVFQAANFFVPICGLCDPGWNLKQGRCFSLP